MGDRVALTVVNADIDGLNITNNDILPSADGNSFANSDGDVYLYAVNASAGDITLTFKTPATVAGGVGVDEHEVIVPKTNEEMIIGSFDPATFNQSDGTVHVDSSAQTDMLIMAFKATR